MKATIQLDRERTLRFSNRAVYRLQSMDKQPSFRDLTKPNKAYAALCAYVFVCLVDREGIGSPEDVAEFIDPADGIEAAMSALMEAFEEAGESKKNKSGEASLRSLA